MGPLGFGAGGGAVIAPLTLASGTITANDPALVITQTWNNAAVTFTAIKANITNTASASASLLMDLQVASTSVFSVRRDGLATATSATIQATASNPNPLHVRNSSSFDTQTGILFGNQSYDTSRIDARYESTSTNFGIVVSVRPSGSLVSTFAILVAGGRYEAKVRSDGAFAFSSTTSVTDAADTAIERNAAGVVEINSGTTGQYRDLRLRSLYIYGGQIYSDSGVDLIPAVSAYSLRVGTNGFYPLNNDVVDLGFSGGGFSWKSLYVVRSLNVSGTTVTSSVPVLSLAQAWNNGAVAFTGIKANITNTASAAASLLMDLQVGGSSVFSVQKDGDLTIGLSASGTSVINMRNTVANLQYDGLIFVRVGSSSTLELAGGASSFTTIRFGHRSSDTTLMKGAIVGDTATTSFTVVGHDAYASATTNLTGGGLYLLGGAGASGSAGAAHGGSVYLDGGQAYGTGLDGDIIVGATRGILDVRSRLTVGTDTGLSRNTAGVLEVNNGSSGTFRDIKVRGLIQTGQVVASVNVETLAATKSIAATDPQVHLLDPDGSDRTVSLPATPATGLTYTIKNTGGANALNVEDSGAVAVVTVAFGDTETVIYDGTAWAVL